MFLATFWRLVEYVYNHCRLWEISQLILNMYVVVEFLGNFGWIDFSIFEE